MKPRARLARSSGPLSFQSILISHRLSTNCVCRYREWIVPRAAAAEPRGTSYRDLAARGAKVRVEIEASGEGAGMNGCSPNRSLSCASGSQRRSGTSGYTSRRPIARVHDRARRLSCRRRHFRAACNQGFNASHHTWQAATGL